MRRAKLLVINNYSMKRSLELITNGELPRHHAWGIDKLAEKFDLRFLNYKCPSWMTKHHLARVHYYWFQLKALVKSIGCKGVYVAASPLVDTLASLKDKGLFAKKLVMVVHHPRNFSLKDKRYDKLLFITRYTLDLACMDYPESTNLFVYDEWGPDVYFYKKHLIRTEKPMRRMLSFISIGISFRDHDTLVEAARTLPCKTSIICTEKSAPKNYNPSEPDNIEVFVQQDNPLVGGKLLSYNEMIERLIPFDVVVVPIPKGHTDLCGLTSFDDAIALGKPVIVSDTAHLGIDLEREGIGFVYKAGDSESLKEKMLKFVNDPSLIERMSAAAIAYAQKNDNRRFSETVLKEFESCF